MNISIKNKLFTSKLLTSKKMLALALCVSLSATQTSAVINLGSIGNSIKNSISSFSFKNILPQTKKGVITFLAIAGIATIANALLGKKQYSETTAGRARTLFESLYLNGGLASAVYASSPVAANLGLMYKITTIFLMSNTLGSFLGAGYHFFEKILSKIATKNTVDETMPKIKKFDNFLRYPILYVAYKVFNYIKMKAIEKAEKAKTLEIEKRNKEFAEKFPLHAACLKETIDPKEIEQIINNNPNIDLNEMALCNDWCRKPINILLKKRQPNKDAIKVLIQKGAKFTHDDLHEFIENKCYNGILKLDKNTHDLIDECVGNIELDGCLQDFSCKKFEFLEKEKSDQKTTVREYLEFKKLINDKAKEEFIEKKAKEAKEKFKD